MKCECGNDKFIAHQIIRVDVVADEHGEFLENFADGLENSIYDAERPYGPYECTVCGATYENLLKE